MSLSPPFKIGKHILHFHDANGTGSFPIAVGKLMAEYRKKLKRSMRGVQIFDAYDPSEARDPSGKWTAGGGSAGKTGKARAVRTPFIQNLAETSGANRTQWIKELAEKEKNRPGIISQAAHAAVHGAVHLLGAVSKEDYEELKEHLAPRSPARETYAHYIRRLVTTPYFLIKSHIKEEYHKFKNAAGALKSLATGHNPTHEQWRGLRQAATTVALTALVFMMTGEPTGTAAHAAGTAAHTVEQIAEHTTEHVAEQIAGHVAEHGAEHSATAAMAHLAEEFGHEMMWHTIYEHSAKFGLGTTRFAAAAIVGMVGEHATEGKETKDAEPNNQTGSLTPDEIKLLQDYFKTLANVVATYPIPDDELRASLTNNKSQDAFDPEEKRDESGKWTSGGGSSRQAKEQQQTVSFVSPNEDPNNLSFEQAHQGLKSPRQKLLAGISHRIDRDLAIHDIRVNHVIGAWSDGAENSVMTNSAATDPDIEEVAAVMKGYLANQKAVLLFHPDDAGHQFLAQFRVASNDLAGIHKKLLQSGVIFHTLEPRGNDTLVHCYGEDEDTLDQFGNAAKQFDQTIDIHRGHGKFIPPEIKDGTDAEQRAASKEAYQQTIRRVEAAGKLPRSFQSQWQNHIDNWQRETGESIGHSQRSATESRDAYDPDEARDPSGKWTEGGGSGEAGHGGTGEPGGREPGGIQPSRNRSLEQAQAEATRAAAGTPKLIGLPDKSITLKDGDHYVPGPIGKVHDTAEKYMKSAGLQYNPPKTHKMVDKERATRIAQAFDQMKHDPSDPKVKAAYQALARETIAQWHAVKESGLKVEWIKPDQQDPYADTPRRAAMDVQRNNHWWGFPTDQGFGTGEEAEAARKDNPLLEMTDEIVDGRRCCVNDLFRIVHDYFGHFKDGNGFRASGEENAWRSHASMYSKEALPAVTSETRGQNSWVNFGPYGETNRTTNAAETHYAPQKIGLMPEWTYSEGREDEDMPNKTKDRRWKDVIIHTLDGVFRFSLKDAEFKREEHPFAPAGTPGSKGGQFVSKGAGGTAKTAKATKAQQQRANTPAGEREAAERAIQPPEEKTKATKAAKPPAPAQSSTEPLKGSKGHPGLISTALPKGKGDEYNKPNLELAKSNPKVFAAQIQVFKDHPSAYPLNQQELQGDDNTVARNIINHIKSNLIFIHDQTPKEVRERTKKWYEGARKLVDEHVKKYKEFGLKDTAVAGVYATLSPNNLWDQNVRQGDRMVDIYLKHRHEPWDKLMDEAVDRTKNETVKTAMQDIAGKTYDELDTPEKRALWIRTYDEGHAVNNPEYKKLGFQPFAKISPEGKREGWYTKPVNVHEFRAFAWTSTTLMGKAVRILEANGDPKVIDESLRADDKSPPQHKVRSFYNNILDPHSANEDVTMDTHAVDAAWLMDDPIAVAHNFGDTPEIAKRPKAWVSSTPSNMSTGMTGNYAFNAEAYREAAHDLHLEPRELQSIVWETKRKWLETMTDENHQKMRDIWEQYGLGYLTQPEAQKQVKQVIDDDLNMTSQEKRDRAKQIRQAKALAKKSAQRVAA